MNEEISSIFNTELDLTSCRTGTDMRDFFVNKRDAIRLIVKRHSQRAKYGVGEGGGGGQYRLYGVNAAHC